MEKNEISESVDEIAKEKTTNTAYVEGIPYEADESELASHFSNCGVIKQIRLPRFSINKINSNYSILKELFL